MRQTGRQTVLQMIPETDGATQTSIRAQWGAIEWAKDEVQCVNALAIPA